MNDVSIVAHTRSAEQTRSLARAIATVLRPGDVVLLAGDLGAGKTTFVQGLGHGLGVGEPVTSPTFTLVRAYPCAPGAPRVGDARYGDGTVRTLLHADLYRLDRLQEVVDLGLGEMVEDGAAAVVEWGDVAAPVLGGDALIVRLVADDGDEARSVTLVLQGAWAARAGTLAELLRPWTAPGDGAGGSEEG